MKKLIKGTTYAIGIALTFWFVSSTAEVVIHNGQINYAYSKANIWEYVATETRTCHVTDCEKADGVWLVTVKDKDGNLWCYYDDMPKAKWHTLHVRFKGDAIVDVSE